jgi:hypothetical protein
MNVRQNILELGISRNTKTLGRRKIHSIAKFSKKESS